MKVLLPVILVAASAAIFQNFLPWWIVAPIAFLISYLFRLKGGQGFLAGFLGVFLLWAGKALVIDRSNEHILSPRIAALIHIPSVPLLILVTGLIGGLVAGIAGLSGALAVAKK